MIRLFTDGACKSNGKSNSKASYAYYFPEYKEWSYAAKVPEDEQQTNNRGQLKAIYEGILKAIAIYNYFLSIKKFFFPIYLIVNLGFC